MAAELQPPEGYQMFVVDEVADRGRTLVIQYGGRIFGGILRDWLDDGNLHGALHPGARIAVRYHTPETGRPGQIAHMLLAAGNAWAEIYADWE